MRRPRGRIALSIAAVGFVAGAVGLWRLANCRTWQVAGRLIARVETDRRAVALTLDDGPYPAHLDEVLDTLARRKVHATFFLEGEEVAAHPEETRRIVAAGHEIGNHSWSHPRLLFRSLAFVRDQIEETDRVIRESGFQGEIRFRPPYGKRLFVLPLYLARTGRTTVMWDVEAQDDPSGDQDPASIERYVLERTRPGSILLFHVLAEARGAEREALPRVLDGLEGEGYAVGSVSELLAGAR